MTERNPWRTVPVDREAAAAFHDITPRVLTGILSLIPYGQPGPAAIPNAPFFGDTQREWVEAVLAVAEKTGEPVTECADRLRRFVRVYWERHEQVLPPSQLKEMSNDG